MVNTAYIKKCIEDNDIQRFYLCRTWKRLRIEVMRDDKCECQICKAKGKYKPAVIVHHIKHVLEFPELALSKYYIDENGIKRRNLISVCKDCHETVCHPERMKQYQYKEPLTEEKW